MGKLNDEQLKLYRRLLDGGMKLTNINSLGVTFHNMSKELFEHIDALNAELENIKINFKEMYSLPNCNDCKDKSCKYRPQWGKAIRINCPLCDDIKD